MSATRSGENNVAFKIFETDPDAKKDRRSEYSDDTVGKFSAGRQVFDEKSKRMIPESLQEWRVATGDPAVAAAVAQLFNGSIVDNEESASEQHIDVFTDRKSVPIILAGPKSIYMDGKQWVNGKLKHHCDGEFFLSHPSDDDKIGTLCGCPASFAERKQAAKDEDGPKPSITFTFRLADDPELGEFKIQTASWNTAEIFHQFEEDLSDIGGEALAELTIVPVEFTIKKGKLAGTLVQYNYPELKRIRSYNDAVAE
jgi:hypothetical protein